MLEGIEKIAQCPVCLDIAKGPVAQCSNGHITCGKCREPLEECSICRGPFIATISRILEELLTFLPKNCPYTDKGCGAVSLLDNHSQYCEFRPIKCLVGEDKTCQWTGTINDWREHVKGEHENYVLEPRGFNQPVTLLFNDIKANWKACCYYQEVEGELFLYYVWKDGNKFCHTLKHVQCKKAKQEFYYKVKFFSQEQLFYKSLIPSTTFKEDTPLEVNPVVFLMADLNPIIKADGTISVDVEAVQLDLPKKE